MSAAFPKTHLEMAALLLEKAIAERNPSLQNVYLRMAAEAEKKAF